MKAAHPNAKLVVGNSELSLEQRLKHQHYPVLINVSRLPDLLVIHDMPRAIFVGASVTWATIVEDFTARIASQPHHEVCDGMCISNILCVS